MYAQPKLMTGTNTCVLSTRTKSTQRQYSNIERWIVDVNNLARDHDTQALSWLESVLFASISSMIMSISLQENLSNDQEYNPLSCAGW